MRIEQDITGALAERIGTSGLSESSLKRFVDTAGAAAERLAGIRRDGRLPLLNIAERTGDLVEIHEMAAALKEGATDIVFLGTGGSSLGGQALAQAGGWSVPGEGAFLDGPRLHFLDNLDPLSFQSLIDNLPVETTRALAVSKSGGTAETLFQTLILLEAFKKALPEERLKDHLFGLSEMRESALRTLLQSFGARIAKHDPGIGGRYSALTNVGLIPAAIMGLDPGAIRAGAGEALEATLSAPASDPGPAAIGAALAYAYEERGFSDLVLWAYADRLERFTAWYAQLWAESLGKDGNGTSPIRVIGPVDQHSQQQLFLGGPNNRFITMIMTACKGTGPAVPEGLAATAGVPTFAGHAIGDLVDAMQRATAETLIRNKRPTRVMTIEKIDAETIGALMMHFFLETIITGDLLGVDPFDQPAVEEGKVLAREYLAAAEMAQ